MMPARYHLISHFRLGAERDRVWDVLVAVEDWPRWWRWLREVDVLREGDEHGLGATFRQTISSPLRYGFSWQVEVVRVVDKSLVELDSTGALHGRGRFEIWAAGENETELVFTWLVETGRPWMNLLAPVGRPLFTWSHDRLMDDFGRGMAARAGGRLLAVSHLAVSPGSEGFYRLPEYEG